MARLDIEDDEIGDLEDDLGRSGLTHEVGVKYTLPLRQGVGLTPELSYAYGDVAGDSNRFHGIKIGTQLKQVRPPWVLVGMLSGFHNQYQKTHRAVRPDPQGVGSVCLWAVSCI